jgi:hypothetical protein
MSDKPMAAVITALVVAPLCAACILGPVVLGSMIAGFWGWLSGSGVLVGASVAILAAVLAYALKRRGNRGRAASAGAAEQAARRDLEATGGPSHE